MFSSLNITTSAAKFRGHTLSMTAGGGEGGVFHLRSDAFIGGEGVQGLEVDRKRLSRDCIICLSPLAVTLHCYCNTI